MLQGIEPTKRREKVMHLFQEMDLDGLEKRYPRELSGGQQQRVAIARAVASEPQLVLADEITANVDSETAQSLLQLMAALNKNNNTTFLFLNNCFAVNKAGWSFFITEKIPSGIISPGFIFTHASLI